MKAKAVSALRDERGLRTAKRNAEPQVVGLAPQTTMMTERANTMKTYILRDSHAVEPQKARFVPAPPIRGAVLLPQAHATASAGKTHASTMIWKALNALNKVIAPPA